MRSAGGVDTNNFRINVSRPIVGRVPPATTRLNQPIPRSNRISNGTKTHSQPSRFRLFAVSMFRRFTYAIECAAKKQPATRF